MLQFLKHKITISLFIIALFALPSQVLAATDYAFTYTFSNQIYTDHFNVYDGTVQVKLTSQTEGASGTFRVTLQRCDDGGISCSWTNVKYGYADMNGESSFFWYGLSDGLYRLRFDQTGGYTVKGYGYVRYS